MIASQEGCFCAGLMASFCWLSVSFPLPKIESDASNRQAYYRCASETTAAIWCYITIYGGFSFTEIAENLPYMVIHQAAAVVLHLPYSQ